MVKSLNLNNTQFIKVKHKSTNTDNIIEENDADEILKLLILLSVAKESDPDLKYVLNTFKKLINTTKKLAIATGKTIIYIFKSKITKKMVSKALSMVKSAPGSFKILLNFISKLKGKEIKSINQPILPVFVEETNEKMIGCDISANIEEVLIDYSGISTESSIK